jgi:hypothetical protein
MAISDDNRFFKFLWRLNSLLIALFFTVLILLIGTSIISVGSQVRSSSNSGLNKAVKVSPKSDTQEEFELGSPDVIEGNDYLIIPLNRKQTDTYNSHSVRSDANILFLNVKDGSRRWLAPDNNQLIQSRLWLLDSLKSSGHVKSEKDENITKSFLRVIYRVIEEDSDGNGLMTTQDKVSIFTSGIDGTGYTRLLEPADKVLLTRQTTDDQFMVMYNMDGQTLYQVFSVRDAKPVFNGKIDIKDAVPD